MENELIIEKEYGPYRLEKILGDTGFSQTFYAVEKDKSDDTALALRRFRRKLSTDEQYIRYFNFMMKIIRRLSHPAIPPILDSGQLNDLCFIVRHYIEGYSVVEMIDHALRGNVSLNAPIINALMAQLIDVLEYTNNFKISDKSTGVTHSNLSPTNIFITQTGQVMLVDFRPPFTRPDILRQLDLIILNRMSPEMAFNKPVREKSDLFLLGLLLYEIVYYEPFLTNIEDIKKYTSELKRKIPIKAEPRVDVPSNINPVILKLIDVFDKEVCSNFAEFRSLLSNEWNLMSIEKSKQVLKDYYEALSNDQVHDIIEDFKEEIEDTLDLVNFDDTKSEHEDQTTEPDQKEDPDKKVEEDRKAAVSVEKESAPEIRRLDYEAIGIQKYVSLLENIRETLKIRPQNLELMKTAYSILEKLTIQYQVYKYFQEAEKSENEGNSLDAIVSYLMILSLEKENKAALDKLTTLADKTGTEVDPEDREHEKILAHGMDLFKVNQYKEANVELGKIPRNSTFYRQAKDLMKKASTCIEQQVDNDVNYQQGLSHLEAGKYELAIQELTGVLAHDPNYIPAIEAIEKAQEMLIEEQQGIYRLFEEASRFVNEKQYEHALEQWSKILKIDPENQQAQDYLYETRQAIEKRDGAISLHIERANTFLEVNRYEQAIEEWQQILELNPSLTEFNNKIEDATVLMERVKQRILEESETQDSASFDDEQPGESPEMLATRLIDTTKLQEREQAQEEIHEEADIPEIEPIDEEKIADQLEQPAVDEMDVVETDQAEQTIKELREEAEIIEPSFDEKIEEEHGEIPIVSEPETSEPGDRLKEQEDIPEVKATSESVVFEEKNIIDQQETPLSTKTDDDELIETIEPLETIEPEPDQASSKPADSGVEATSTASVRQLLEEGLQHYGAGNYSSAIDIWSKVLAIDPNHEQAIEYIELAREEAGSELESQPQEPEITIDKPLDAQYEEPQEIEEVREEPEEIEPVFEIPDEEIQQIAIEKTEDTKPDDELPELAENQAPEKQEPSEADSLTEETDPEADITSLDSDEELPELELDEALPVSDDEITEEVNLSAKSPDDIVIDDDGEDVQEIDETDVIEEIKAEEPEDSALSDDVEEVFQRGFVAFENGDYETAINEWNYALSINPEHTKTKILIKKAQSKRGEEIKEEIQAIPEQEKEVTKKERKNFGLYAGIGAIVFVVIIAAAYIVWNSYTISRNMTIAQEAFSNQNYADAISYYTKYLEKSADDSEAIEKLGVSYLKQKKYQQVVNTLKKIKQPNITVLESLGEAYYQLQNYQQALKMFKNADNLAPNKLFTVLGLAKTYNQLGDPQQSVKKFQQAETIDASKIPDTGWIIMGKALANLGEHQSAIDTFKKVREHSIESLSNIGSSYYDMGDYEEAAVWFNKAKEKDVQAVENRLFLGKCYYRLKRYQDAIDEYLGIIELYPDDLDVYLELGTAYLKLEKFDDAIAYYQKALQYHPDNPTLHFNLGVTYHAQNDLVKAKEEYQTAIELREDYAEALANLGTIYYSQRERDTAKETWLRSLKINPDQPQIQKYLSRMGLR